MDGRSIRHVVANVKKLSADFRRLYDVASSTMHVDDVRSANVSRGFLEESIEELDDIEHIAGVEARILASIQDNLAAARRLLQGRRVIVGSVSPSTAASSRGRVAAGVEAGAPLVVPSPAPAQNMHPLFQAPLHAPSLTSVASEAYSVPSFSMKTRTPSMVSSTSSVRRERALLLIEAQRKRAEEEERIAEEEKEAEETARAAKAALAESAAVSEAAIAKTCRLAKNKANRERQRAEDDFQLAEIEADEVLEEGDLDLGSLADRRVILSEERDASTLVPSTNEVMPEENDVGCPPAIFPHRGVNNVPEPVRQEEEDANLARRLQEEEKEAEATRRMEGLHLKAGQRQYRAEKTSRQLAQAAASAPVPEIRPAFPIASQVSGTAVDQLYLLKVLKNRRPAVKFSGGSFDVFEAHHQSFLSAVDIDGVSSSTKLRELSSWYSGAAGEVVSRFLRRRDFDQAYSDVLKELKSLWGTRLTTASEMLSSVLQGRPIANNNVSAIRHFFIKLGNIHQLAVETGRGADFDRRSVHDEVLAKLPQWKLKWVEKRSKLEVSEVDKLTFSKLLDFLRQRLRFLEESTPLSAMFSSEEDEEEMPVASSGNSMMSSRRGRGRKWSPRRTLSPSLGVTSGSQPEAESCVCCSAPHFVENCRVFKGFSAAEKADVARRSGLCYSCLDQGHTSSTCTRKKPCATCKRDHHDLMHEWLTSNPISARIQSGAAAAAAI